MEYVKSGVLNEEVRRKTQGSLSSHSEGQSLKTAGEARVKVKGKMVEKYCYKWKRENKPENSKHEKNDDDKHNDQVAIVTSKDFFILYDDDVVNVASQETRWTVKMGNDGLAKVIGIGDVCLEMDDGSSLLLRDVKHILDIHLNLISIGRLDDKGYCNTFSDDVEKIEKVVPQYSDGLIDLDPIPFIDLPTNVEYDVQDLDDADALMHVKTDY
ncbi:hypothetical protein Pint_07446 [Pistacia integerrima]|uniref:Uncharacterized protein n=1 Tax=Pistacia integerrima TaxID=434235 RepID=A0ACC0XVK2_9ROSI|nr:hypothetical protein Pint_07446 [Pistacia integerrima]